MLLAIQAVALGILASIATRGHAAPQPPYPTALIAAPLTSKTFMTPDGPLADYERPTKNDSDMASEANNATTGGIQKRCGSNAVVCDTVNAVPDALACWTLIYNQGLRQDTTEVPECKTWHCTTVNGQQCCISWSANVPGLQLRWLFNGASDSYRGCLEHGRASGRTFDTNLNGVCLVQCLSNRPDGCA